MANEWVDIGLVRGGHFDLESESPEENILKLFKQFYKGDGTLEGQRVLLGTITAQDGQDGQDGTDGQDGQDGADGQDGQDGQDGADGQDGQDGQDGEQGQQGEKGDYYSILAESQLVAGGTDLYVYRQRHLSDGTEIGQEELIKKVFLPHGQDGTDGQDGDYFNLFGEQPNEYTLNIEKQRYTADNQAVGGGQALGTLIAPQGEQGVGGDYFSISGQITENVAAGGTDIFLYRQRHLHDGTAVGQQELVGEAFLEYGKSLLSVGYYSLLISEDPPKHLNIKAQWWCATNIEAPLIFEPKGDPIPLATIPLPAGPPTNLTIESGLDWVQIFGDINDGNGPQQLGYWQRAQLPVLSQNTEEKTVVLHRRAWAGDGTPPIDTLVGAWKDANYAISSTRLAFNGQDLILYITRLDGAGEIAASTVTLPSVDFRFNASSDNSLFLLEKQNGANWDIVSSWGRQWFSEYYQYWIAADVNNANNWGLIQQRYVAGAQVGDAEEVFRYEPSIPDVPDYTFTAAEMGNLDIQDVGIGLLRDGEIVSKFDYHLSVTNSGEGVTFWRRVNDNLSEMMMSRNIGYDFEKTSAGNIRITRRGDGFIIFEEELGATSNTVYRLIEATFPSSGYIFQRDDGDGWINQDILQCCSDQLAEELEDLLKEVISKLPPPQSLPAPLEKTELEKDQINFGNAVGEDIATATLVGGSVAAVALLAAAALTAPVSAPTAALVVGGALVLTVGGSILSGAVYNTGGETRSGDQIVPEQIPMFTIPRQLLLSAIGDSLPQNGGSIGIRYFSQDDLKKVLASALHATMAWVSLHKDGYNLSLPPANWDDLIPEKKAEIKSFTDNHMAIVNDLYDYDWSNSTNFLMSIEELCSYLHAYWGGYDFHVESIKEALASMPPLAQDSSEACIMKLMASSLNESKNRGFNMANCYEKLLSFAEMTQLEPVFDCAPPLTSFYDFELQSHDFQNVASPAHPYFGRWVTGVGWQTELRNTGDYVSVWIEREIEVITGSITVQAQHHNWQRHRFGGFDIYVNQHRVYHENPDVAPPTEATVNASGTVTLGVLLQCGGSSSYVGVIKSISV